MQLSRVAERSSWRNGHQAKEILIGDEFSVIILDVSCCFLTKIILWMYRVPSDIS